MRWPSLSTTPTEPTPYSGQPQDPKRKQVVKTKEERSTHRAHRLASFSVLLPSFRLVVSLPFRPKNGGGLSSFKKVLHDFHPVGGKVRAAFLDRGYYACVSSPG